MARCNFCGRTFNSAQSVRAHLKICPKYLQHKQRQPSSAAPRARSDLSDEERIRHLFKSAPSSSRTPAVPTTREPRPTAPRPTPGPDPSAAQALRAEEARRERAALQEEQRRQAAEQRSRDAQRRTLIQQLKWMTIDLFFTCERIPAAARADAKVVIERVFAQLPILELPQHELLQIATAVREHVYDLYRQTAAQITVAVPPRHDVTPPTVYPQQKEMVMPMHRMFSGDFFCPRCDEEFALDRVPENEALCPNCRVALEEFEADEGDDDGE